MVLTALLVGTSTGTHAATASSSLESTGTIHVAIFQLDAGTIYVNVPDDLGPGERGSAQEPIRSVRPASLATAIEARGIMVAGSRWTKS